MLLKILGGIDLISGLILILLGTGIVFSKTILIFMGMLLLLKSSFGLLKDFASWIDFLCGAIFILSAFFDISIWISAIFGVLIFQKGLFSFL